MNCIQVLSDYLCHQFTWWKDCQFRYEPDEQTVYVYSKPQLDPEILMREAEAIAQLDIGVKRFIITVPSVMDMVIECRPNQYRESL